MEPLDPRQVAAWRAMIRRARLELAFQAYQFALDIVRLTEKKAHPDLSPDELAWASHDECRQSTAGPMSQTSKIQS